jgi:hypothetical protein
MFVHNVIATKNCLGIYYIQESLFVGYILYLPFFYILILTIFYPCIQWSSFHYGSKQQYFGSENFI